LAQLIAEIERNRPDVYRELRRRYVESILAIEQVKPEASTTTPTPTARINSRTCGAT
jgi:hypothetical protein